MGVCCMLAANSAAGSAAVLPLCTYRASVWCMPAKRCAAVLLCCCAAQLVKLVACLLQSALLPSHQISPHPPQIKPSSHGCTSLSAHASHWAHACCKGDCVLS